MIEFTVFSKKKELTAGAGFGLFLAYLASFVLVILLANYLGMDIETSSNSTFDKYASGHRNIAMSILMGTLGQLLGACAIAGFILLYIRRVSGEFAYPALGINRIGYFRNINMFLAGFSISLAFNYVLQRYFPNDGIMTVDYLVDIEESANWVWYLSFFSLVVMAPLNEEFLFRSVIYKAFSNSYGKFIGATFSTLLFSAVHREIMLSGSLLGVSCLLSISSLLLIVRINTDSILPSIFLHSGFNAANFFPINI